MTNILWRAGGLILLGCLFAACSSQTDQEAAGEVATLEFNPASATLYPGESSQTLPNELDASGHEVEGTPEVDYVSSNPAVATAVAKGESYGLFVTAVSPGTATITATCCNGKTATYQVTVVPTTWIFDSISGPSATVHWVDAGAGATLNGTQTFTPPTQVMEGQSFPVTSTFGVTFANSSSHSLSWGITSLATDITLNPNATSFASAEKFITADSGSSTTGTVTATGNWTIPAGYDTLKTLKLAATSYSAFDDPWLVRVAYYHKLTH